MLLNPNALVTFQLELDTLRTRRDPELFRRKLSRMLKSPHAFLRGSAPMFYACLQAFPELETGFTGSGWIVGDAHLENFGAYPTSGADSEDGEQATKTSQSVVFDLNDFDDATIGPLRYDTLRLTTSLLLWAREYGPDARSSVDLAFSLLDGYRNALLTKDPLADDEALFVPKSVLAFVEKAKSRSREDLLGARTEISSGERRFIRGERYGDLRNEVRKHAEIAFAFYADQASSRFGIKRERLDVVDMAFRIAGTGSLGALRIGVLVRGKGGSSGHDMFDMKEQGDPSAAPVLAQLHGALMTSELKAMRPAERIVSAMRASLLRIPQWVDATELDGASMLVRRLTPQEDKLDANKLAEKEFDSFARMLGSLLGRAHRHGARSLPDALSDSDLEQLLDRAMMLAGLHEAVFLSLAKRVRLESLL